MTEQQPKTRKKLDLSETNMALAGSKYDKECRQARAANQEEWQGAGTAKGIQIWRIEKFNVVACDKKSYGSFYNGDSYIILQTHGEKDYDVFFYLGEYTSQDECGAAAIKTIELDDLLGQLPRQHREVGGHESAEFMDLFDDFTIYDGGVASGFTKATPIELPNRLFQLRSSGGIRSTKRYQVPLAVDSLNEDDAFILDADRDIYIFQGRTNSPGERILASRTANKIADKRSRGCKIHVISSDDAPQQFWQILGAKDKPSEIKAQPDTGAGRKKSLHKISDSTGKLVMEKIMEDEKIPKTALKSADCFLLDTGVEVFVWVGKGCSGNEKINAMPYAQQYLNDNKRDPATCISRVFDGREGAFFLELVS